VVKAILVILFTLFAQYAQALTQVTATVDKNPVNLKESFILTVTADDDVDANALDTSPLLTDFIVGRTSVSSQTSMINFNTTRTTTWQTVLIPKRTGTITIPTLAVEGLQTTSINLTVVTGNDATANSQRDVFITTSVSNNQVYVQQMLTLTVKLHFAAELKRGSLTEPALTGATISQVGQDKESDTIINGKRYRVIERTFSVTPQQSGEFLLKSPMFSGEVMVQSSRRSNFLSFGETKSISALGDELPITVKAKPAHFQGHWLPSELLTLHQEWQPADNEFKVGEPITRTITLTAVGVSEEQLPEINLSLPTGLKVYPDQQSTHHNVTNARYVSQSVNNYAIVASQAGEYLLPAVEVPWWNTITNRLETSTLPAQKIIVIPNSELPTRNTSPAEASNNQEVAASNSPIITETKKETSQLQWLFLGLWLLTLISWLLRERSFRDRALDDKPQISLPMNNIDKAIITACENNDGKQVLTLLPQWFNKQLPTAQITSIADIKLHCNDNKINQEIDALQSLYFGKSPETQQSTKWNGSALRSALKSYKVRSQSTNNIDKINP